MLPKNEQLQFEIQRHSYSLNNSDLFHLNYIIITVNKLFKRKNN